MVKLKDIPSQDGMRIQSVTDFFQPWKQTKMNKKEGKGLETGEVIEFSNEITNDDNTKIKIKINQTEESTEQRKLTRTTKDMDPKSDMIYYKVDLEATYLVCSETQSQPGGYHYLGDTDRFRESRSKKVKLLARTRELGEKARKI